MSDVVLTTRQQRMYLNLRLRQVRRRKTRAWVVALASGAAYALVGVAMAALGGSPEWVEWAHASLLVGMALSYLRWQGYSGWVSAAEEIAHVECAPGRCRSFEFSTRWCPFRNIETENAKRGETQEGR